MSSIILLSRGNCARVLYSIDVDEELRIVEFYAAAPTLPLTVALYTQQHCSHRCHQRSHAHLVPSFSFGVACIASANK